MRPTFDQRDAEIRDKCAAALDKREGPRVGDWVIFADGVTRRISHDWSHHGWGDEKFPDIQTSADGYGYFLGEGYVSFSGSLFPAVRRSTLTLTDEKRNGRVWFFHHGWQEAHNSVETEIPFRVFRCSENAPK